MSDKPPTFCHRCGTQRLGGRPDFYTVRIEAFADPDTTDPDDTSPDASLSLADEAGAADLRHQMRQLVEQMADMTERELMDGVHRRLTLQLCGACYRVWIEDPAPLAP